MNNEVWLKVLQKIADEEEIPFSLVPKSVREKLQQWGESSGAVSLQRSQAGAGRVFKVVNLRIVEKEIISLDPNIGVNAISSSRLRNLAINKDTKAGLTTLEYSYYLCKAIGDNVFVNEVNVSDVSKSIGCFALPVRNDSEGIICRGSLLLVENQQLLDDLRWVPSDFNGIILYYAGNLSARLRMWLTKSSFVSVILFPDYDAVGINNYANLVETLPDTQWFWMHDWKMKLEKYGCKELRRKGNQESMFDTLWSNFKEYGFPDAELESLMTEIRKQGKMLEQEAVLI
ncbi:hypothetical protein IKQ19_12095 [Candidatus Saccharibacteria bacterium]|nr:hypothetical protein [Candidatus Saccharibacteria bacterium]